MKRRLVCVDFETDAIEPYPNFPPTPAGVAIHEKGRSRYYAWRAHNGEGLNADGLEVKARLTDLWKDPNVDLLFHNAKFDLAVASAAPFHLEPPPWHRIHDTLLELFLFDPNLESLSLKPASELLLGLPPEEQNDLYDWIAKNVPEAKRIKSRAKLGAFIVRAPVRLVGPYAKGDVARTVKLHRKVHPRIPREAYDRERRLLVHLLREEPQGIPVDVPLIETELERGEAALSRADKWLRRTLGLGRDVKLTQRDLVADAMEERGIVHPEDWTWTKPKTGKPRRVTTYESLSDICLDDVFLHVWRYRSILATQVSTFAKPWLKVARDTGCVFPEWNQVRQADERGGHKLMGARTGRLSSTPNLMNVPKVPVPVVTSVAAWRKNPSALYLPFRAALEDVQLLNVRSFIKAPRGQKIIDRDYSQQELRILAHYEDGPMRQAYERDPHLDFHNQVKAALDGKGLSFERTAVKNTNFGIIYAMGLALLARKTGLEIDEASTLRRSILGMYPGVRETINDLKAAGECTTWGGRLNRCEEPQQIGEFDYRTFEYKLINTLIQGSAADCTKEAAVRFYEHPDREARLPLFVHDQLTGFARTQAAKRQMALLKECMESVEFRVPMLSTGATVTRWSEAK